MYIHGFHEICVCVYCFEGLFFPLLVFAVLKGIKYAKKLAKIGLDFEISIKIRCKTMSGI